MCWATRGGFPPKPLSARMTFRARTNSTAAPLSTLTPPPAPRAATRPPPLAPGAPEPLAVGAERDLDVGLAVHRVAQHGEERGAGALERGVQAVLGVARILEVGHELEPHARAVHEPEDQLWGPATEGEGKIPRALAAVLGQDLQGEIFG